MPEALHRLVRRVIYEGREDVSEDGESLVDEAPKLPQIASNPFTTTALLIVGVLWLGLDLTPGWPGWLVAVSGLVLSLRVR